MGLLVPVATRRCVPRLVLLNLVRWELGVCNAAWLPATNIKQRPLLQQDHALPCTQGVLSLKADGMCMCVRRGQWGPH
jgi:hypothetical protein